MSFKAQNLVQRLESIGESQNEEQVQPAKNCDVEMEGPKMAGAPASAPAPLKISSFFKRLGLKGLAKIEVKLQYNLAPDAPPSTPTGAIPHSSYSFVDEHPPHSKLDAGLYGPSSKPRNTLKPAGGHKQSAQRFADDTNLGKKPGVPEQAVRPFTYEGRPTGRDTFHRGNMQGNRKLTPEQLEAKKIAHAKATGGYVKSTRSNEEAFGLPPHSLSAQLSANQHRENTQPAARNQRQTSSGRAESHQSGTMQSNVQMPPPSSNFDFGDGLRMPQFGDFNNITGVLPSPPPSYFQASSSDFQTGLATGGMQNIHYQTADHNATQQRIVSSQGQSYHNKSSIPKNSPQTPGLMGPPPLPISGSRRSAATEQRQSSQRVSDWMQYPQAGTSNNHGSQDARPVAQGHVSQWVPNQPNPQLSNAQAAHDVYEDLEMPDLPYLDDHIPPPETAGLRVNEWLDHQQPATPQNFQERAAGNRDAFSHAEPSRHLQFSKRARDEERDAEAIQEALSQPISGAAVAVNLSGGNAAMLVIPDPPGPYATRNGYFDYNPHLVPGARAAARHFPSAEPELGPGQDQAQLFNPEQPLRSPRDPSMRRLVADLVDNTNKVPPHTLRHNMEAMIRKFDVDFVHTSVPDVLLSPQTHAFMIARKAKAGPYLTQLKELVRVANILECTVACKLPWNRRRYPAPPWCSFTKTPYNFAACPDPTILIVADNIYDETLQLLFDVGRFIKHFQDCGLATEPMLESAEAKQWSQNVEKLLQALHRMGSLAETVGRRAMTGQWDMVAGMGEILDTCGGIWTVATGTLRPPNPAPMPYEARLLNMNNNNRLGHAANRQ